MKKFCLTISIAVSLLICFNELQAQTLQTASPKAGSEYNVLDALSGIWTIQGEARDSVNAPYYHLIWTLNGRRILNGYAIEILREWHASTYTQKGVEITGYDPVKKTFMCHIFYDDGTWWNSTFTFPDKRNIIENGANYYPNGRENIMRVTWNFGEDFMSQKVKGEILKNNHWYTLFELIGTRTKK